MVLHGLCLLIRHIWSTFTHEDMNGSRNIVVFTENVSIDLGSILQKPIAVNVIIYKPQHPDDVSSIFYGVRCSDCPLGHCDGGGKKAFSSRKTVQTRREVTLLPRFGPICYGTKPDFSLILLEVNCTTSNELSADLASRTFT